MGDTILSQRARFSSAPTTFLTPTQTRAEALISTFVEHATDGYSLAALAGGGLVYRVGRVGTLALGSRLVGAYGRTPLQLLIRPASIGVGFTGEVLTFEAGQRALRVEVGGADPSLLQWSGENGLARGLVGAAITLGSLKGTGAFVNGQNPVLQHLFQDGAMVLAHNVSGRIGIADAPKGSIPEQFVTAEATLWQMKAGMALVHGAFPGLGQVERSLDLAVRSQVGALSASNGPLPLNQPLFAAGLSSGNGSSPGERFPDHILAMSSFDPRGGGRPDEALEASRGEGAFRGNDHVPAKPLFRYVVAGNVEHSEEPPATLTPLADGTPYELRVTIAGDTPAVAFAIQANTKTTPVTWWIFHGSRDVPIGEKTNLGSSAGPYPIYLRTHGNIYRLKGKMIDIQPGTEILLGDLETGKWMRFDPPSQVRRPAGVPSSVPPPASPVGAGRVRATILNSTQEYPLSPQSGSPYIPIGRAQLVDGMGNLDGSVSSRHALLFYGNNQWWIFDERSSNGTFLGENREPIPRGQWVPLPSDLRLLRFGNFRAEVKIEGPSIVLTRSPWVRNNLPPAEAIRPTVKALPEGLNAPAAVPPLPQAVPAAPQPRLVAAKAAVPALRHKTGRPPELELVYKNVTEVHMKPGDALRWSNEGGEVHFSLVCVRDREGRNRFQLYRGMAGSTVPRLNTLPLEFAPPSTTQAPRWAIVPQESAAEVGEGYLVTMAGHFFVVKSETPAGLPAVPASKKGRWW